MTRFLIRHVREVEARAADVAQHVAGEPGVEIVAPEPALPGGVAVFRHVLNGGGDEVLRLRLRAGRGLR